MVILNPNRPLSNIIILNINLIGYDIRFTLFLKYLNSKARWVVLPGHPLCTCVQFVTSSWPVDCKKQYD